MADTFFAVRNCQAMAIRLDPTDIRGEGSPARPILYLPLQLQMTPTKGERGEVNYTLLRLAGALSSPAAAGEFTGFEMGPLLQQSHSDPFYRQLTATPALDHARIKQFEDGRSDSDAHFLIRFSGLLWFAEDKQFQLVANSSPLEVNVPRSHWVDHVLMRWGLSSVKLIAIRFPRGEAGENYRISYERVEAAEKLFANALYKEVLTELRRAFEALARSHGYGSPDKAFFEHLFEGFHSEKKEKARDALLNMYRFLHLGPHEPAVSLEERGQPAISRCDARFALTATHTILEYITSNI